MNKYQTTRVQSLSGVARTLAATTDDTFLPERHRATIAALALALALALAGLWTAAAGATTPEAPGPVEDRYIVVLRDGAAPELPEVLDEHDRLPGVEVEDVYHAALDGYTATVPESLVPELRDDPRVALVEKDRILHVSGKKRKRAQQSLPWGISRIDADASSTRAGDGGGSVAGVDVYVIDTGIANHPDLNVAHAAAFNSTGDGMDYDCMGHGTHVAGTIAARDNRKSVVGGAPGAPLTGVKVFGCDGSGTTSGVIAGIDWVTAHAQRPAVANMSLGGGVSAAMDRAVQDSVRSGVFYAVAAGNQGVDACTKSPARAGTTSGILTVAATTQDDAEASFSNYGPCVDLWAPGAGIPSTSVSGGTTKMSGTSMAAPHAAGAAALYLSRNPGATPGAVEARLKADAVATGASSRDGRGIERLDVGGY